MKVTLRTEPLRVVRAAHQVPGVMYGRSIDSISIQADINDVLSALKTYGKTGTFKIRLDDKYHHVYFKAVQSNVLKPNEVIHFDLHRVTEKELVTGMVPIEMIGHEVFYNQKMFAELVKHEILATYSPVVGHAKLVVDVSKMELHDEKKLHDLNLEGLEIKEDLNQTIVIIKEAKALDEEPVEKAPVIVETAEEETLSKE